MSQAAVRLLYFRGIEPRWVWNTTSSLAVKVASSRPKLFLTSTFVLWDGWWEPADNVQLPSDFRETHHERSCRWTKDKAAVTDWLQKSLNMMHEDCEVKFCGLGWGQSGVSVGLYLCLCSYMCRTVHVAASLPVHCFYGSWSVEVWLWQISVTFFSQTVWNTLTSQRPLNQTSAPRCPNIQKYLWMSDDF